MNKDFVIQSTLQKGKNGDVQHLAIIMDGNRRWARRHGMAAHRGHFYGAKNIPDIVKAAVDRGIPCLTLFAFGAANMRRADDEREHLWRVARHFLPEVESTCLQAEVRLEFIGRLDRLPVELAAAVGSLSKRTVDCTGTRLRIALDYSARWAIWRAARQAGDSAAFADFARLICGGVPPVDLLIRTGDEQRLSDFLLWECAFAELYFSRSYWPDFDARSLDTALDWYARRQRRFGE